MLWKVESELNFPGIETSSALSPFVFKLVSHPRKYFVCFCFIILFNFEELVTIRHTKLNVNHLSCFWVEREATKNSSKWKIEDNER